VTGDICGQFQFKAGCSTLGIVCNNSGSWFQFKADHATSGCCLSVEVERFAVLSAMFEVYMYVCRAKNGVHNCND
jgi:hypothetical protein